MAAGIPCSQYKTVGQAIADPQMAARGVMQTVTDAAGAFQVPNPPFKFDDNTVGVSSTVSAVGEYTREILTGLGGITSSDLDEMISAKHVFAGN